MLWLHHCFFTFSLPPKHMYLKPHQKWTNPPTWQWWACKSDSELFLWLWWLKSRAFPQTALRNKQLILILQIMLSFAMMVRDAQKGGTEGMAFTLAGDSNHTAHPQAGGSPGWLQLCTERKLQCWLHSSTSTHSKNPKLGSGQTERNQGLLWFSPSRQGQHAAESIGEGSHLQGSDATLYRHNQKLQCNADVLAGLSSFYTVHMPAGFFLLLSSFFQGADWVHVPKSSLELVSEFADDEN